MKLTTETLGARVTYRRKPEGISAILLPFQENGEMDLKGLAAHIERTCLAGLTPAVNMDTGYTNLLSVDQRRLVLEITQAVTAGQRFVAGAFIEKLPGDPAALYASEVENIQRFGGLPIVFQTSRFQRFTADEILACYRQVASGCDAFLGFELGRMFAPNGMIYELELVRELMQIPQMIGMKHSSLQRNLEWQRLAVRDEIRPEFKLYTGNDLAIDMIMYGCDYLLGLSTFAPDYFAKRDEYWAQGDVRFYALNDLLQYLGQFAFRAPVSAYKHSAAQFLKLRGWLTCSNPHAQAARRPTSDVAVLALILEQLESL
ncbi:MAG: dihydrodipicolinate synthase family protein [Chloroflexi bacterium HGW-Chloroflexi-10]|nr:MAG: dihydrodipicolinate synthase family protein [Chloroflexi bacterium HGW-Chloroflexi-10]